MKRVVSMVAVALVFFGFAGNLPAAEETLIDTVANGCKTEITTYCKTVTSGEGRLLQCLEKTIPRSAYAAKTPSSAQA